MPTKIKFETSDGMTFDVDVAVARCFRALPTMVGNRDLNEIPDDEVIPLKNVKAVYFEKVLQWAQIHQNDPDPLKEPAETHLGEWEHEFLQSNTQTLHEMINVASYLQISRLEYLLRREVIKRGLSELRKTQNIEDFRPTIEGDAPVEGLSGLMDLLNMVRLDLLKEAEQPRRFCDNHESDFFDLAMSGRSLEESERNLLELGMGGRNSPEEGEQMREENDESNLLDLAMGGRASSEDAEKKREENE